VGAVTLICLPTFDPQLILVTLDCGERRIISGDGFPSLVTWRDLTAWCEKHGEWAEITRWWSAATNAELTPIPRIVGDGFLLLVLLACGHYRTAEPDNMDDRGLLWCAPCFRWEHPITFAPIEGQRC
jgi:hypothetical protein